MKIDLADRGWQLRGWRPFAWQMRTSMEIGFDFHSDIPALPAAVPGSVQSALLAAGWLKDWNTGLNALDCEWVEHRHWEFFTDIAAGEIPQGKRVFLCAEGLDYSGWILLDGRVAAAFGGALMRHRIELPEGLSDGRPHVLSILFDLPPPEQGQIGFTSESRYFKPRYNYGWDWCPRLVPVGISDALTLEAGVREVELRRASAHLADDLLTGTIEAVVVCGPETQRIDVRLGRGGRDVFRECFILNRGENRIGFDVPHAEAWWPNGEGGQPLYELVLHAGNRQLAAVTLGFKRVRWLPCQGAPDEALPWICEINGRPVFLRGVNWTPIRLDYHTVTAEDYRRRIALYRGMGCNVLRVWGGGFLERKVFYDLCDEAGLLVWQEFPLSSSGIDNWPPENPDVIAGLCAIARDYIRRRAHHASKLLWCGGNELQHALGQKTGIGIPVGAEHPCLAALARVVEDEDAGTRFLPASSSGPRFTASADEFGQGLHHDVHGPWNVGKDLEDWREYWERDDALFRSETGVPGASPAELIRQYCGNWNPWPPESGNPYWLHGSSWWLQWERFRGELEGCGDADGLENYAALSQQLQADALAVAARSCRDRFPRCGGILIWMGHDAFPCPANTSVIDFAGNPKPAYYALRGVFRGDSLPD